MVKPCIIVIVHLQYARIVRFDVIATVALFWETFLELNVALVKFKKILSSMNLVEILFYGMKVVCDTEEDRTGQIMK